MSLIVHHLNNSRSQRILWLLEELELPYELRPYQRDAVTNLAPPELKAIHPLGKSPVLQDDALVLAHGRVAAQGPCATTLTPALIRRVWDVQCQPVDLGDGVARLMA